MSFGGGSYGITPFGADIAPSSKAYTITATFTSYLDVYTNTKELQVSFISSLDAYKTQIAQAAFAAQLNAYQEKLATLNFTGSIKAYKDALAKLTLAAPLLAYKENQAQVILESDLNAYLDLQANATFTAPILAYVGKQATTTFSAGLNVYADKIVSAIFDSALNAYEGTQANVILDASLLVYKDIQSKVTLSAKLEAFKDSIATFILDGDLNAYQDTTAAATFSAQLDSYQAQIATLVFDALLDATEAFYGWAINLDIPSNPVSKYEGLKFNSMSALFACAADGIYTYGGLTDNGTAINGFIQSGDIDFNNETNGLGHKDKRVVDYYQSSKGDATTLSVDVDGGTPINYTTPASTTFKPNKNNLARGAHGRFWRFKVANTANGHTQLQGMEVNIEPTSRNAR